MLTRPRHQTLHGMKPKWCELRHISQLRSCMTNFAVPHPTTPRILITCHESGGRFAFTTLPWQPASSNRASYFAITASPASSDCASQQHCPLRRNHHFHPPPKMKSALASAQAQDRPEVQPLMHTSIITEPFTFAGALLCDNSRRESWLLLAKTARFPPDDLESMKPECVLLTNRAT
jgi:hypothetical protein